MCRQRRVGGEASYEHLKNEIGPVLLEFHFNFLNRKMVSISGGVNEQKLNRKNVKI